MGEQLSLFDYQAPSRMLATVICHPNWIRARARQAACEILRKPLDKQDWHRRDKISVFCRQLEAAGLSPAAAVEATETFALVFECEMRRQIIAAIILEERGGAA